MIPERIIFVSRGITVVAVLGYDVFSKQVLQPTCFVNIKYQRNIQQFCHLSVRECMLRYVSELRTVSFDAQVTVHRDKLRNYFISK